VGAAPLTGRFEGKDPSKTEEARGTPPKSTDLKGLKDLQQGDRGLSEKRGEIGMASDQEDSQRGGGEV